MNRALAAIWVACIALWAASPPAGATPPVPPRTGYLYLIEEGEPEGGRRGLRDELTQYRELWLGAFEMPGPRGLENRLAYSGELMMILSSWYTAEARALQQENSKDCASALAVLDEWLPLSQEVEEARTAYRAEAAALEATLDPVERRSRSGLFDRAHWDDGDRLPLAAARLAKLCRSEAQVERVFQSFGGRVGDHRDAPAYFRASEDFQETLGLRERDARRRAAAAALAAGASESEPPGPSARDQAEIRELIGRFYAATIERDAEAARECLSPRNTQRRDIEAGMQDNTDIVRIGEIEEISFESEPDGAVEVAVEGVEMTRRVGADERITIGSQTFLVVLEDGGWKILEVGR